MVDGPYSGNMLARIPIVLIGVESSGYHCLHETVTCDILSLNISFTYT